MPLDRSLWVKPTETCSPYDVSPAIMVAVMAVKNLR